MSSTPLSTSSSPSSQSIAQYIGALIKLSATIRTVAVYIGNSHSVNQKWDTLSLAAFEVNLADLVSELEGVTVWCTNIKTQLKSLRKSVKVLVREVLKNEQSFELSNGIRLMVMRLMCRTEQDEIYKDIINLVDVLLPLYSTAINSAHSVAHPKSFILPISNTNVMSLSVYARGNSHPIYDLKVNLESAIRKLEDDSGEDFRALEAKCQERTHGFQTEIFPVELSSQLSSQVGSFRLLVKVLMKIQNDADYSQGDRCTRRKLFNGSLSVASRTQHVIVENMLHEIKSAFSKGQCLEGETALMVLGDTLAVWELFWNELLERERGPLESELQSIRLRRFPGSQQEELDRITTVAIITKIIGDSHGWLKKEQLKDLASTAKKMTSKRPSNESNLKVTSNVGRLGTVGVFRPSSRNSS